MDAHIASHMGVIWAYIYNVVRVVFMDHINEKVNKAYSILSIIKRNFIYLDTNSFVLLYKAIVRPHSEYAN